MGHFVIVLLLAMGCQGAHSAEPPTCLSDGQGCFDHLDGMESDPAAAVIDCTDIGDKLPTLQQWADLWAQEGGPSIKDFNSPITDGNPSGLLWALDINRNVVAFSWRYGTTNPAPSAAAVICIQ